MGRHRYGPQSLRNPPYAPLVRLLPARRGRWAGAVDVGRAAPATRAGLARPPSGKSSAMAVAENQVERALELCDRALDHLHADPREVEEALAVVEATRTELLLIREAACGVPPSRRPTEPV